MTSSQAGDSAARSRRSRRNKAAESTEVVLGGGAYRGFSHCGLLQAIEELNINTGIITGVSIGSLIATLYTNGFNPQEIEEIFATELTEVPTPSLVRSLLIPAPVGRLFGGTTGGGLIDLPALFAHLIEKYDLRPQPNLRIVAYNLIKREPVVFEGLDYDLLTAICASCRPLLMRPFWFGQPNMLDKLTIVASTWLGLTDKGVLVDGGVASSVPRRFLQGHRNHRQARLRDFVAAPLAFAQRLDLPLARDGGSSGVWLVLQRPEGPCGDRHRAARRRLHELRTAAQQVPADGRTRLRGFSGAAQACHR